MSMGPITAIIPRPVRVRLGSEDYLVGEFRLLDLADLQVFLDETYGDPIEGIRGKIELEGVGTKETQKSLALAYKQFDGSSYPFVYGEFVPPSVEVREAQGVHFVKVALARYQPEINEVKARRIIEDMLPGQMSNLSRIVWGTHPVDEIGKLLGWKQRKQRSGQTWPKMIAETATAFPAYTLSDIYGMTLTELYYLRSGGKPMKVGQWYLGRDVAKAMEDRRSWWNWLFGE